MTISLKETVFFVYYKRYLSKGLKGVNQNDFGQQLTVVAWLF